MLRDDEATPLTVDLKGTQIDGELDAVIPSGGLRTLQSDGVGPQSVGWVTVTSDLQLALVTLFGETVGVAGVANSDQLPADVVTPIGMNTQRRNQYGNRRCRLTGSAGDSSFEILRFGRQRIGD